MDIDQITPYLIARAQQGEESAKLTIMESLTPMVKKLSRYWDYKDKDDAIQTGSMAILIALTKYNIVKHNRLKFSTFAYPYIKEQLQAEYARINGVSRRAMREIQAAQYGEDKPKAVTLSNGIKVDNIAALELIANHMCYQSLPQYANTYADPQKKYE